MSNWLSMEIVSTDNFEERVALVSRLVDIMVVRQILIFVSLVYIWNIIHVVAVTKSGCHVQCHGNVMTLYMYM